jgi:hypothetical protein
MLPNYRTHDMTRPFVAGDPRVPRHVYFQKQWGVPMPVWAQNMRFFSADAPFDPDMPGAVAISAGLANNISSPEIFTVFEGILRCTSGIWSNNPTFTYQWKRDVVVLAETSDTYFIVPVDSGSSLTCIVSATTAAGVVSEPSLAFVI